jgi:hypothetical protein
MDLGFNNRAAAKLRRRLFGLSRRGGDFAGGYRHAVTPEQLLSLELVNVHWFKSIIKRDPKTNGSALGSLKLHRPPAVHARSNKQRTLWIEE